jgi:O-antigen/teichoic acid export membrane protein
VKLLYGSEFGETVHVVAWLSALPMIICLASVMGMQTLVPLGHHRWYSGVLLTCGLVNCLVLATMGYLGGATGAAMAVVMTEFAILFGMTLGVKRHAPQIWQDLIRHS